MKNFLVGVLSRFSQEKKEEAACWEDGHGRRDGNDISCWLPAILIIVIIIEAWEKLWCQEKKHNTQ